MTRQLEMFRKQTDTRVIRSGTTSRETTQKVNQAQGQHLGGAPMVIGEEDRRSINKGIVIVQ